MSDHADKIAEAKRGTAGYSEGDLRSLAKQLAAALEATVRERDALAAQNEMVRYQLNAPSDERGITWWEWIEGGLGGSLHDGLRAALTAGSARILAEHDAKVLEAAAEAIRKQRTKRVYGPGLTKTFPATPGEVAEALIARAAAIRTQPTEGNDHE